MSASKRSPFSCIFRILAYAGKVIVFKHYVNIRRNLVQRGGFVYCSENSVVSAEFEEIAYRYTVRRGWGPI